MCLKAVINSEPSMSLVCINHYLLQHCDEVVSHPASYSVGPGFDSSPEARHIDRLLVAFLSPSR
jgi:hypothetical protein